MAGEQPVENKRSSLLATKASRPGSAACDVACEAMPGYVIGDLQEADQTWLHAHTSSCNYCRNELHWYERIDQMLEHVCESEKEDTGFAAPAVKVSKRTASYGAMPSPVGDLLIAVSNEGICEISFGRSGLDRFIDALKARGFEPVADQQAVEDAASQLREYFNGRRHVFDLTVDLTGVTPFTQDVLKATASVPFGKLVTYGDIARTIGKPNATRAVGNALGRNPIPVIVPCHRIIRSDLTIGGYTGGLDIKERLLSIEGALLPTW